MKVKLNCWRGEDGPGTVVELPEHEAAALLHHGAAHPVEPDAAATTGKVVKGSATLQAASGTEHTP